MLRYTLEHGDWTTISEEFQLLQRYCGLQKIRFQERLEFDIRYEEETGKYKIPKLLLQPLVENAIIHGIEPLGTPGKVSISAALSCSDNRKYLRICISDNGVGFDMGQINADKSIGLSNVRERLMMAYGFSRISIVSHPGAGTDALIEIPQEDISV